MYYFLYLFTPLLLVLTLAIPFLGLGLIFSLEDEFFGNPQAVKYSDKNFRLEIPFTGILGNQPESPTLIVKKGMFEYEDQVLTSIHSDGVFRYDIYKKSPSIILVHSYRNSHEKASENESMTVYLNHPIN